MEETFDFAKSLANNIIGQKRTGKAKQFVFIREDYAIKGPYNQGRFNNVITRSQIFDAWETPCVVKAIDYFTIADGTFVRFPNIMAGYQLESEPYTEPFSGLHYNVLKNAPVIDVGHAITAGHWIPERVEDLILALCHCNILGVGDMNIRNTLIDPNKRLFYIIDFDDNLGTDRNDEVFYFNKAPGKKLMWYDRVGYSYNQVSDRLTPLLNDPIVTANNLGPRVQRAIDLLRHFAKTGTSPATLNIQPKIQHPPFIDVNPTFPVVQTGARTPKHPTQEQLPTDTVMVQRDANGIYFFNKGKYSELSNYWVNKDKSPLFSIDGKEFKSSEHAYQYYKFSYPGANQNTLQYAEIIRNADTPNDAKLLGGQKLGKGYQTRMNNIIRMYQTIAIMNPNWDTIKIDMMRAILSYKFTYDAHSQQVLLSTSGHMLYEDSPYDSYWGIGENGTGENWLGKLLVEFRNKLDPTEVKIILQNVPLAPKTKITKAKTQKQPAILQIPGHIQDVPITTALPPGYTIQPGPIPTPLPKGVTIQPGPIPTALPKGVTMQNPTKPVKIGKMVWKGLRGGATKTYSGVDFDVAKSAVQKYIRRNIPQKAILAAIELYRLGEVGGDPGVTNMYNRLAIIANEDIGPANLPLVLEITRIVESGDRDVARLATMVQLMCESPKTRMMSHAWRAYANPEGRDVATKLGLPVDTGFTESDIAYITENKNSDLFLPTDPENIRPYVLIFLKRLYEKDFNAFSWAYFFLETAKDITLTKRKKLIQGNARNITGKSDILLWKALSLILSPETHDILVDAYYNHTESRPFLQNAILTALYKVPYKKLDIEPAVEVWRNLPLLQQMLNGDYTLEIDPYVIDKHTRQGRALGKTIQDFVDEGATVTPQDPTYYSEILENIYKMRT